MRCGTDAAGIAGCVVYTTRTYPAVTSTTATIVGTAACRVDFVMTLEVGLMLIMILCRCSFLKLCLHVVTAGIQEWVCVESKWMNIGELKGTIVSIGEWFRIPEGVLIGRDNYDSIKSE